MSIARKKTRGVKGRGGWRPGAGRPRGRTTVEHGRRERFVPDQPQLVTLRVAEGVRSLRAARAMRVIRQSIQAGQREAFRVVEVGVEPRRLQLLVHAGGARALSLGMTGLKVRLARQLNRVLDRSGSLFPERYSSQTLRTPAEVRAARRRVREGTRG